MKSSLLIIILIASSAVGCSRENMEESPEALVSYGRPSQHSNFASPGSGDKPDTSVGWLDSSAIDEKPTATW